jgi:hypothetical protein
MEAPVVLKPIPTQVINELSAYGPFQLSAFIQTPDHSTVQFQASLSTGESLPKGLICSSDGILTGIPAKNTYGEYEVLVHAENEAGVITSTFFLVINQTLSLYKYDNFDHYKFDVWQALEQHLPLPDLIKTYNRPITIAEVHYLLERWTPLKIWDVYNLDPPGEKIPLNLEGMSKHYQIYDRGSCLIATPKDLFSHDWTIQDGLQTAKVLAQEVYKRRWAIELVGFERLTRAAWVEIQRLSEEHGYTLDIINYRISSKDVQLHLDQKSNIYRPEMD